MKNLKLRLGAIISEVEIRVSERIKQLATNQRGDVPGWVLITVMTAGLVVGIWSIAGPQLKSVLNNALRSVVSP